METGEKSAIKEIWEELGTDISSDSHLCTITHQYSAFMLIMDCYLAHIVSGEIVPKEHVSIRWLDKNSLLSVDCFPVDLTVIEYIGSKRKGTH